MPRPKRIKKKWAFLRRDFLSLLGKTKNRKRRKKLIDYADRYDIRAICECIQNFLNEHIDMSPEKIEEIGKYKTLLRSLMEKELTNEERKRALKQRGGFLPLLIPAVLSAISGIAGAGLGGGF